MREILFRGKRSVRYCPDRDWTYGVPFIDHEGDCIFKTDITERVVDPETVGQYTGLTDKNGKKIFEGDILNGLLSLHPDRRIFQVGYEDNGFYFFDEDEVGWHPDHIVDYEVIGNIHDNPKLLKGGE